MMVPPCPPQRTDYWKSQERKYCDFCKCWITDNKPSVQFHENGKRHKENVAKKISELTKKSAKAQKESQKMNEDMKKMNEAAMKAYLKDMELNPDFTSLQYKKSLEEKDSVHKKEIKKIVKQVVEKTKEVTKPLTKTWYEAKSEEGHTYFWNTKTKESVWEPPTEGYLTFDEQKKVAEAESQLQKNIEKEASEETRARDAREKMKKFKKVEESKVEYLPGPILGPAPKANPYGKWQTVQKKIEKPINWQLPKMAKPIEINVPLVIEQKPKIKEKQINSLNVDDDIPTVFKKRKPNPNRGNIRQRFEED